MKNVLFVMPFLGRTGAERVICNLINNIDPGLYRPHVLLYAKDPVRNTLLKSLPDNIPVSYLNVRGRARYNLHKIIFGIRRYCKENDIETMLISDGTANAFISPFLFILGRNVKKIARESNLPSLYEKNPLAKMLYKLCYKNYDVIIVQSDDMLTDLTLKMGIPDSKVVKINNPLDIKVIREMSSLKLEHSYPKHKVNLLTIGRLTYQKGFDILINAFSKISNDNFHLTIVGTGEEKEKLTQQVNLLGLRQKITFIPSTENPYALMKHADVFISSSRWEGYPNVVIESLACGTPVVANNYPGGINEIIHEKNGFICNLETELSLGLEYVTHLTDIEFDNQKIIKIFKEYESLL